jgi:hypothetical protein
LRHAEEISNLHHSHPGPLQESPATSVRFTLLNAIAQTDQDELSVTSPIYSHRLRLLSFEISAEIHA